MSSASVFVPATIGNVGPGFDVLGLAVEGLGDTVHVTLSEEGPSRIASVTGRDHEAIPLDVRENCAAIAALSLLRRLGDPRHVILRLDRQLPVAGGLGSSAAASVGGALAALTATGQRASTEVLLAAALDGEERVSGRHLDNIAPCLLGGLCIVRGTEPPEVAQVPVRGEWWITLISPALRLSTKKARSVLPSLVTQQDFIVQMANTASLVLALTQGDHQLARRALVDLYAEPRRAPLINGFGVAKQAALAAGALGCSISGAGPSLFALCADEATARRCAQDMVQAFLPLAATAHTGAIARKGARPL